MSDPGWGFSSKDYKNAGIGARQRAAHDQRGQRDPGLRSALQHLQRARWIDWSLQALIFTLTLPGLYLIGDADPALRWIGAWIALAAQPFWLIDTWRRRQHGMFLVALVFTALWLRMIYTGW